MSRMRRCDWSVGVIVPAQNEETTIGRCIDSIIAAAERGGRLESLWMVIVADACTDATVKNARRALGSRGEVFECSVRSAGTSRRLGAEAALAHFHDAAPQSIWLANTDADTSVPVDWIDFQLELADNGITGVAGIVILDANGCPKAHQIYRDTYQICADGTHGHVHGANIALRADAYIDVGGWRDLRVAEDHCLWGRLRSRGWRVSSPARSFVTTSARLKGRARGGFADTLRARIDAQHSQP